MNPTSYVSVKDIAIIAALTEKEVKKRLEFNGVLPVGRRKGRGKGTLVFNETNAMEAVKNPVPDVVLFETAESE
jgi:hypothetical protein